jgi:dynein regulatory complex protein 1
LEAVTNIRVAADARASLRRFEERKKMEAWKDHRKQDASFEKERMSNIDGRWSLGDTMNHPHDLRALMEGLKKECDALIDNKNKLIAEYMAELKSKDDDYVKELKRQTEEIGTDIVIYKSIQQ